MKKFISILLTIALLFTITATATSCLGNIDDEVTTYKVTFNTMGGEVINPKNVVSGQAANRPILGIRTGYEFGGWYSDEACTTEYNFSAPVTADITIYAKWTEIAPVLLDNITISGTLISTIYVNAEAIDLMGVSITKHYDNNTSADVSFDQVTTNWNEIKATAGAKSLVISYTEGEITKTATLEITVNEIPVEPLVLKSISVQGEITATNDLNAETVDLTGITITKRYTNNDTGTVAIADITTNWNDIKGNSGAQQLIITYTEGDVTKTYVIGITITEKVLPVSNFIVPEGGYDGSAVTLKFYTTMGQTLTPILETYIEAFNTLYPNIQIDYDSIGGYDDVRDQITTEIPVGTPANFAYCYPDHVAAYNLAGAVATLDDLINSTEVVTRADSTTEILGLTQAQIDDFIQGYYEEGRQFGDGLMYTMPFSKSTEVLYYNKTFFEANDLSVPTTWNEMEVLCARILEIDSTCIPLGYDSEANWFITMCEQYGSPYTSATGDHFLFNNETNRNFVANFRDWYNAKYITTQAIYGAYTSGLFVSTNGNESYMSIGSSAGATHQRPAKLDNGTYPFEVGIAPIPQINPSDPKVISQGPSICIFKKANPQEVIASWLFIKYLITSVDFQAEFSMASGYVPVIKSVAQNTAYANFLDNANGGNNIAALSAKVCLAQEDYYYTSPAFNGSSKARDEVGAIIQYCLVTPVPANSTVAAMIEDRFKKAVDECEYFYG